LQTSEFRAEIPRCQKSQLSIHKDVASNSGNHSHSKNLRFKTLESKVKKLNFKSAEQSLAREKFIMEFRSFAEF
tara:strand:+ start:384 stop:605 length:222 start_codon:yes stop_codon:yes gene_type:complete